LPTNVVLTYSKVKPIRSDKNRKKHVFAFPLNLNVQGTRIMAKTQSIATGTAHKLKLDESARVASLERRATSRNVINDHCEFEIGLKRTIGPSGKAFWMKRTHHLAPHTHFGTQIERRSVANCSVIFVISSSDHEF
jgi:hypothetical protein